MGDPAVVKPTEQLFKLSKSLDELKGKSISRDELEKLFAPITEELKNLQPGQRIGVEAPPLDPARAKELKMDMDYVMSTPSTDPAIKEAQRAADDLHIAGTLFCHLKGLDLRGLERGVVPQEFKSLRIFNRFSSQMSGLAKAMNTVTSGEGLEWIPTQFSPEMIDLVRLKTSISTLFERWTMPTNPWIRAVAGADNIARLVPQVTTNDYLNSANAIPVFTPGTDQTTFTAKTHGVGVIFTDEMTEDSAIAMVPYVRDTIVRAMYRGEEYAIASGDTTAGAGNINGALAATDVRLGFDGLRKSVLAGKKVDCSTFNLQTVRNIRSNMGVYGTYRDDLVWMCSLSTWFRLLNLKTDGGDYVAIGIDKVGADRSTFLTGQMGFIDGIAVVCAEPIPEDLNASGVYDGVTTDKTILLCAYRPGFKFGDRRDLRMEQQRIVWTQQTLMLATRRLTFKQILPGACVNMGYGIPTA